MKSKSRATLSASLATLCGVAALAPASALARERPFLVATCGAPFSDDITLRINAIVVDGVVRELRDTEGTFSARFIGARTVDDSGLISLTLGDSTLWTGDGYSSLESFTLDPNGYKVSMTYYVSGSDGDVHVASKELDCSISNVGLLLRGRLAR